MPVVVGVSLRTAGKIYYFDPGDETYDRDERVLVETARGLELGCVKQPPHEVDDDRIVPPLKRVTRRAREEDLARDSFNRQREAHALETCKRLVAKLNLPMRLIDAQYTFDGSHVLIHFLAENRVDFRELVRELAHELRTRIELRQVGVRDEAKLLGGYGMCGRHLCCASFLSTFIPVAINTAKDQGLALNPQKISGMCGRLMCCLSYEHECYKEVGKGLPRMNSLVVTPRGSGKVTKLNVLARQVEVAIPDLPTPVWFSINELGFAGKVESPAAEPAPCAQCPHHDDEEMLPGLDDLVAPSEPRDEGEDDGATGEAAQGERRRRRRRKKPAATGAPPAGQPADAAAPPPPRPQPVTAGAPAAGTSVDGEANPARRRRRRRR